MNDRGLSLTPTDMLKGFLLANINDEAKKLDLNRLWKNRVNELLELDKDKEADAIKTWLRSQYAQTIRESKKGTTVPADFDRISSEFHRWVRDHKAEIGLSKSTDFVNFIQRDFDFYTRQYIRLRKSSNSLETALEEKLKEVFYNPQHIFSFTLQYLLLLAPLNPNDSSHIINQKIRLVASFLDILLARKMWNCRSITYDKMQYPIFMIMRDIRGKAPAELVTILRQRLDAESEVFASNNRLGLNRQNKKAIFYLLARITDHIEQQSGLDFRYKEYSNTKNKYEIEHIWADDFMVYSEQFSSRSDSVKDFLYLEDFSEYRNRIGGLLLLPKSFNASYGAMAYVKKLPHYYKQNLLAQSLNPQCYEHNPGFLAYKKRSGLPFQPHQEFKKADLDLRQRLYQKIAEEIWNPDRLNKVLES
jgi:hypothetical protein